MTPLARSIPVGELRRLGDRAFLIGVADAAAARELAAELTAALAGAAEAVCGAATVMVHATDPETSLSSIEAAVEAARRARPARPVGPRGGAGPSRHHPLPLRRARPRRGGRARRCSPDEVVALLTAEPLTATVMGFSPGFAYLEGLPEPAGPGAPAVAAASRRAGGVGGHRQRPGRRLSDRVTRRLAPGRPHRLPLVLHGGPALRRAGAGRPGPLHRGRCGRPARARPGGRHPRGPCRRTPRTVFEVVAAGLRAVVQDGGRRGVAAVGVPAAGPADPVSFDLANRVGGERGAGGHAGAHGGRDAAALPRRVPRGRGRRRARGPRRRQPRLRPDNSCPWPRARCSTSVASTADAVATCRWPAGSSGPSGSGAAPATS